MTSHRAKEKDLQISIVESLDGGGSGELFPFLPYILQDIAEIGADPRMIEKLLRKDICEAGSLVLDLGCGKGAVSVHLAEKFGCRITGIDGMEAFISEANKLAAARSVSELCSFSQGDIRIKIRECKDFDIVILGAIGPVFGFIGATLKTIATALKPGGYVVVDDGYKPDGAMPGHDRAIEKTAFYEQISQAGFTILEERIMAPSEIYDSNRDIQNLIVRRVEELVALYPEKETLFRGYVQAQEEEIDQLENRLVVGVWLLQHKVA